MMSEPIYVESAGCDHDDPFPTSRARCDLCGAVLTWVVEKPIDYEAADRAAMDVWRNDDFLWGAISGDYVRWIARAAVSAALGIGGDDE